MLNLNEARSRIHNAKDWQSRSLYIEVFHSEMMLNRKKWSIRKTAAILNLCASTTCEDLMLSKYASTHPEVSKIKLRVDAITHVRRIK